LKKDKDFSRTLFEGLNLLAQSAFPKKCKTCGRLFETAEQFLEETEDIRESVTGLKQSRDDEGAIIVEAFRNCPCGSTLMDFFNDRRDQSRAGDARRKKFNDLLEFLLENDLEREMARNELLKVMRGEKSEILARIRPPRQ
jgi:transcriptional accessory protein Tex/SPT6